MKKIGTLIRQRSRIAAAPQDHRRALSLANRHGVQVTLRLRIGDGTTERGGGPLGAEQVAARPLIDSELAVSGRDQAQGDFCSIHVEASGLDAFARTRASYRFIAYDEEARIRDVYAAGEDKMVFRKAL